MYPFIFDGRKIPQEFHGIEVWRSIIESTVPEEIDEVVIDPTSGYKSNWTPQQFHNYVVYWADEIREELGDPDLLLGELLDAICLGDYENLIRQYDEGRIQYILSNPPPHSESTP